MKKELLEEFQHLMKDLDEAAFETIDMRIKKNPESISYFKNCFLEEDNLDRKEIFAHIIISHEPYEDAIIFLMEDRGWEEEDFEGFDGYSKWKN